MRVNRYLGTNGIDKNRYKFCKKQLICIQKYFISINEQIQNIAQKKDTLCRMMYN